ncbi:MAG TPA: hemin uptake protein HemP [Halothiobacillaceae bacterium]|nr:hemin uptake protein HemP [Halothiobacillaceae bacterium]
MVFNQSREVVIVHNQVRYHLRITRSEKLILTK